MTHVTVKNTNRGYSALTVAKSGITKRAEILIADGGVVTYGTGFTPDDVAALVSAAYLLGKAHAIADERDVLTDAATVLRRYQGSDSQDAANVLDDLAAQLGLGALTPVSA